MNYKKVDYIVVGCGLAGIAFCEQLRLHNKTAVIFDNQSVHSTNMAAGIFNPVVLKRFTPVWNALEQLQLAKPHYQGLEKLLNVKIKHDLRILRKFNSIEEQNEWFTASDNPVLDSVLSTKLVPQFSEHIKSQLGFGEVVGTGRVDTKVLTSSYKSYLKKHRQLIEEPFHHSQLTIMSDHVSYEKIHAQHIVFAEGFGLKQNPLFNFLPLNGTKGEMLTIHAPDLNLNCIIKSSVFIVPLGNDTYWVGATYNRDDKTYKLSEKARSELIRKLDAIITCDYEVINHEAGIRPTTKDRRPLVGTHPEFTNVHVLNGLGTRGVMISPFAAKNLYNFIEFNHALNYEMAIDRFN